MARGALTLLLIFVTSLSIATETVSPLSGQQANLDAKIQLHATEYPLAWQRRLLAIQLAFATTLPLYDDMTTGSITPQGE